MKNYIQMFTKKIKYLKSNGGCFKIQLNRFVEPHGKRDSKSHQKNFCSNIITWHEEKKMSEMA